MAVNGLPFAARVQQQPINLADPTSVALAAAKARARGVSESSPVTPIKPKADQSGASGSNDYFTALGYEA